MFGTVVAKVAELGGVLPAPRTDVDALRCGCQSCAFNILFACPTCRPVEIFGASHQLAGSSVGDYEEHRDANKAPAEDDHLSEKQRHLDARILRGGVVPAPDHPREWLVQPAAARTNQGRAKSRLILKLSCEKLGRSEIDDNQ